MVRLKRLQRLAAPVRNGGDKVAVPLDVAGQEHAVERLVVDDEDGCLSRDQVKSCSAARSAPTTRAYSSSTRREQLGRGHERPRLRHHLQLPTELGQPRRSEHSPVGLERVRRPTQLLRVRGLERASQCLEQRGRLAQEGVDKLDHEGAIARRYAEVLERIGVEDATPHGPVLVRTAAPPAG
jgi:hypothetical protein